jgi:GntR family transcriptional repressor for pyruvate dehydrogenase complex
LERRQNVINQLKPVDNRRLYQQIADQIRGLIKDGGFSEGSRLPPERDLAQQLGVSRPSVREALIALELEGSVEVRMGAGVYVCAPPERAPQSTASLGESPIELMQARSAFEGSVVALACGLATPEGIATVSKALAEMRAAIEENRSPLKEDRAFHLAIAAMTGNSVMERVVRELFDGRHSPISSQLRVRSESSETWMEALREHEGILRALESRDVLAAQTAMRSHLQASQDRWVASRREWS